jgi:hypothetical protein
MRRIVFYLSLIIFYLQNIDIQAQPGFKGYLYQISSELPVSFNEVQQAYYKWYDQQEKGVTRGHKQFKRWEWYWESRVYPDGRFPDSFHDYNEFQKAQKLFRPKSGKSAGSSSWISLAPATVPSSTDESNINGMGRINCIEFHPTDTATFWIGSASGGVWKTSDGGQSWIPLTDNMPILRISSIAVDPHHPDTLWIATGDIEYFGLSTITYGFNSQYGIGVFKSIDGGQSWIPTGLNFELWDEDQSLIRRILINPANTNEVVAAGMGGIFKTYDGGDSWVQISSKPDY